MLFGETRWKCIDTLHAVYLANLSYLSDIYQGYVYDNASRIDQFGQILWKSCETLAQIFTLGGSLSTWLATHPRAQKA